jgi:hypothetical protein
MAYTGRAVPGMRAHMAQAKMKKQAAPGFHGAQAAPIRHVAATQAPTRQPRGQKLAQYSGTNRMIVSASSTASATPGVT